MADTEIVKDNDSFILDSVWINLVKQGERKTSYHEKGSLKICDDTFKLMSSMVKHSKSFLELHTITSDHAIYHYVVKVARVVVANGQPILKKSTRRINGALKHHG